MAKEQKKAATPVAETNGEEKTCLVPDCGRKVQTRGLCNGHAQTARKAVDTGQVTWEDLIAAGMAMKPSKESKLDYFLSAAGAAGKKAESQKR